MPDPTLAELRDWLTERIRYAEGALATAITEEGYEDVEYAQRQLDCATALLRLVETQGRDTLRLDHLEAHHYVTESHDSPPVFAQRDERWPTFRDAIDAAMSSLPPRRTNETR